MDYKQKLEEFNSTSKYKAELDFLLMLTNDCNGSFMDYGCGIGTAMNYIKRKRNVSIAGYDIVPMLKYEYLRYVRNDSAVNLVFFMHSIAHIENIKQVLTNILDTNHVVVITPNADWLAKVSKEGYISDSTVYKHYTQAELVALFESCGYVVNLYGSFGNNVEGFNERIFLKASKL